VTASPVAPNCGAAASAVDVTVSAADVAASAVDVTVSAAADVTVSAAEATVDATALVVEARLSGTVLTVPAASVPGAPAGGSAVGSTGVVAEAGTMAEAGAVPEAGALPADEEAVPVFDSDEPPPPDAEFWEATPTGSVADWLGASDGIVRRSFGLSSVGVVGVISILALGPAAAGR